MGLRRTPSVYDGLKGRLKTDMTNETIAKRYEKIYKLENIKLYLRFDGAKTRMEMYVLYGFLIVGWAFAFLGLAIVYQQIFPYEPFAEQLAFILGPAVQLAIWRRIVVTILAIILLIMMLLYTVRVITCTLCSEEEQSEIRQQVVDKMNALVTPDELRLLLPAADETTMETVKKAIEAKQVLCVDDVHISRPEEEKNE